MQTTVRDDADEPAAATSTSPAALAVGARDRRYLPALDGLRALAVVAVLAYHLGRLRGGFLGVDLFFVISGYLITSLLLHEVRSTGGVALRSFWLRRMRRLLPALLVVLVAVMVAGRAWWPSWRWGGLRADALATLGYVANWRLIASGQSYFSNGIIPSPLRHAWSLGIEEQFYVVWPVLVALALRSGRRARPALGAIAGVGIVASTLWMARVTASGHDPSRAYYGTDTRAATILVGVLLAVLLAPSGARRARRDVRPRRERAVGWFGVAGLVGAGVFAVRAGNQDHWMYRGGFLAFALLAAATVAATTVTRGPLARVLALRPLRWLGRISYAMYLWSWPVQTFAQSRFHLHGWRLDATVALVVVALAAASGRFVERPIRTGTWSVRWPTRTRWLLAATAVAVVVAVVVSTTLGSTRVPEFLTVSDREAAASALRPAEKPADAPTTRPRTTPTTTAAAPGATVPAGPPSIGRPVRVMITGDSVGWSLGWGMGGGAVDGALVDDRGLIGCGIMPQSQSRWITAALPDPQTYYPNCDEQQQAEELGLQGRPDAVVLSVGTWEIYDQEYAGRRWRVGSRAYGNLLTQLLQQRIDRYRAAGAVTLVTLVPCYGDMAPRLGDERRDPTRVRWLNDLLRAVARRNRPRVITVDPGQLFCRDGRARGPVPGVGELRPDGVHFSEASARWIWNTWLTPKVTQAVIDAAAAKLRAAAAAAASTSTTAPAR